MSRTLGFLFQIKGCSEILFINLSDCLPPAGPLLDAQKWAEKPLGRPWPRPPSLGLRPIHLAAPHFCPIGRHQGRCTVATEFLRGRWPLVISAVLCRTSPDSPRTEGCCPVFLWQNPIQIVILNQKYTDIIQDSCCQSCTAADPSGSAPGSCPPGSPELPPWSAPG